MRLRRVSRPLVAMGALVGGVISHFVQKRSEKTGGEAGRTIRETRVRHETGALIVALKKADGSFDTTPDPD